MEPVLEQARSLESEIQRIAFEVLRNKGDYTHSQRLLALASEAGEFSSRLEAALQNKPVAAPRKRPATTPQSSPASRGRKNPKSDYPIIYVSENRIVKIGKGKQRGAKEYRHEAPRASFERVVAWINNQALAGTDEWMARDADMQLNDEVPTYQIYLAIAALRKANVLTQVRRGWYSVAPDVDGPEGWWSEVEGLEAPKNRGDVE